MSLSGREKHQQHSGGRKAFERLKTLALRKIWLPRTVYRLIPAFYFVAGSTALLSALFLDGRSWLIPYALLFAGMTLHATILIGLARLRGRRRMARSRFLSKGSPSESAPG